jgi:uncharacterized protein YodC (DUF2158 family)
MTTEPRFKVKDKVKIRHGGHNTIWEVKEVEPATDTRPTGYVIRANNRNRGVNEDQLEPAEAEVEA